MLATLFDDNNHIAVAKKELEPAYNHVQIPEDQQEILPDGTRIIGRDELIEKSNDQKHGTLYRLSFAVRALQDAFNNGNMADIPDNALR